MGAARRWLGGLGRALGAALLAAALPIAYTETACIGSLPKVETTYRPILPEADRRNLVDTYLTYPEWSIVHAYEDFAEVARDRGEAAFDYSGAIFRYWRSLCSVSAIASSRGTISSDVKAMLYIIGISFSAEFAIKGLYEESIGRLTRWWHGPAPTAEDAFALKVAKDYARFLQQVPWYEYPFGKTLVAFWQETPWTAQSGMRALERRVALTLEYGVKAIYAQAIAALAGLAPAPLTIRSIIAGFDPADAAGDGTILLIAARPDGSAIVESPRYRAFTRFMLAETRRGRRFIEIAGNREIFVTVLARAAPADGAAAPGAVILAVPVQARPGWERRGLVLPVESFAALVGWLDATGGEFEHAYDY